MLDIRIFNKFSVLFFSAIISSQLLGNVPLHEWTSSTDQTISTVNENGEKEISIPENLTTWIFEDGTFIPQAKLQGDKSYSIITDHLGTPTEAYNEEGQKVWSRELGIYGQTRKETGVKNFVPYLYQGQYLDVETELAYNRFRYYSPESGTYVSQDPIRLVGQMPNMYAYVPDVNSKLDPVGLSDIWYRALHPDDMTSLDAGGDINAKVPDAKQPATNHVNFGSENWYGDQYVSVTKDPSLAEKWARNSGTEVVEIDMNKSQSKFLDLSTPEGRKKHILDDAGAKYKDKNRAARLAEMMQEGLVEGKIEKGAITRRYTPPSCK